MPCRSLTSGKRVYAAPVLPWGWLGLRWVQSVLFPKEAVMDLAAEAREFHRLFYGMAPSGVDLDAMLEGAKG